MRKDGPAGDSRGNPRRARSRLCLAHSSCHGASTLHREVALRHAEVQVMGPLVQLIPDGRVGCLAGKAAQLLGCLLAHLDTIG